MAATDSTLKIEVVTEADLTGVNQVRDQINNTTGNVAEMGAAVKTANEEVVRQGNLWGVTRAEAAAMSREISEGAINARSLGTALSGLGAPIAVIGIAMFTIAKLIYDAVQAQQKFNAEVEKSDEDLLRTSERMLAIAAAARSQSDFLSLLHSFNTTLDELTTKLSDFTIKAANRSFLEQVASGWHMLLDAMDAVAKGQEHVTDTYRTQADRMVEVLKRQQAELLLTQDRAQQVAVENINLALTYPVITDRVAFLNAKIAEYQEKMARANVLTVEGRKDFDEAALAAATYAKSLEAIVPSLQKIADHQLQLEQNSRLAVTLGNTEAHIREEVNQAYVKELRASQELGIYGMQMLDNADAAAKAKEQELRHTEGLKDAHRELTELYKEDSILLQQIRANQQLIQQSPFMGADEKQVALLGAYRQELTQIGAQMRQLAAIRGGITDPVQLEQINQQMLRLQTNYTLLQQKIIAGAHPIQAAMQQWVNSFGKAAEQLATTIQETIGAALQGINQWIVTGKFNLQSMMQSIELLGLKLIEQLVLQQVMAAINARINAELARLTGAQIAASMAPAATAATIATQGGAALAAPAQVGAALAIVEGMFAGGQVAHEGGLIMAQSGEIVIRRAVANENRDFLLGLNAGGGRVTGSRGGVNVYAFTDMKALTKHMASRDGQKIIFDTVKGNRINLGIG
jgi:hypothetical protein